MDSSQGSESWVVILSTTRPGRRYGLGFLTKIQRSCVALSRAISLGTHILDRCNAIRLGHAKYDSDGEKELGAQVLHLQRGISAAKLLDSPDKNVRTLKRGLEETSAISSWKDERIVFCTASTTSRSILKEFYPRLLIVEDASQMHESTTLFPMSRF